MAEAEKEIFSQENELIKKRVCQNSFFEKMNL